MAGSCIATVKIIGVSSLGLLAGSLTYQSLDAIPLLLNGLSKSLYSSASSSKVHNYVAAVKSLVANARISSTVLSSVASILFALSFHYSPPSGQHPYLIYAAIGGPLTVAGLVYQAYAAESKLLAADDSKLVTSFNSTSSSNSAAEKIVAKEEDEEDNLGKSYIHVSDESSTSSTSSTPATSAPNSPNVAVHRDEQPVEDVEALSVEEEVESALAKKDFINNLEKVRSSYVIGSAISSVSFFIAVVGLIGDYYLL
ncbi:Chromodomain-helicase DNA-binding protein [Scheffersomyces stipitis CBS 6054]|uniref:Chromodomain-helicase DNA-binding protein n=1 Tax=Scheffersomyces stipitis (strain ATCC 58785 / CBS 6054 / NBRC 10063 / NRRL Y-11545) TaxID=322104 RepID=A3LW53_PICST|nr:Chromodomain-helicase DNA-binding protein [Scheffersomyces stipitis CBS 6054]ABN66908.1 Chromodomain-helicase DNA-binding protein [Scheffersomyces stipitis CBS 6054]KAG2734750.1 hypothetical protein G9P44_002756 [Scheffersomyces stipitis]